MYLLKKGAGTLSIEFLTQPPRDGMMAGGILTPLIGTMQLVIVSMGVALPVGIITGLYFAEYAKDTWFVRLMRISIRSLAGVPSVIFGLFGLSLFVVFLQFGSCLLSAGLTLACLSLPLVVTVAEQAFLAVPQDYRDASYAPRRDEGADDFQGRPSFGGFHDNNGRDSRDRPCGRRDGADNVHGRGVLRPEYSEEPFQPGHGSSVPHIRARDLRDRPGRGGADRVRRDTGAHRAGHGN